MATVALGLVGAGLGAVAGNWELGWAAGTMLAGVLFPERLKPQNRGKLDDLKISGSGWGSPIPQVWGAMRLGGNVIWATDLVEHHHSESAGGKGTRPPSNQVYTYTCSFLMSVCRGPIAGIRRIWAEDQLIYDSAANPTTKYDVTIYGGTETQEIDSRVTAALGSSPSPNYRGTACVLFWDLDLTPWGGRIPAMTFEINPGDYTSTITGDANLLAYYKFEDSPGFLADSGPYGYDLTESGGPSATQTTGPDGLGEALDLTTNTGDQLRNTTIGSNGRFQGTQLSAIWWLKKKASGTGALVFSASNSTGGAYSFSLSGDSGGTTFSAAVGSDSFFTLLSGTFPSDGEWHLVGLTLKTSGQAKLYLDGSVVDFDVLGAGDLTTTGLDRIRFEDGRFYCDEAAIFDRELTADEMTSFAAGGGGGATVGSILADLFDQVGLDSSEWDVSAATDPVTGFTRADRSDASSVIEPLLRFYSTDLAEIDGQIVAVKRGGAAVVTIPEADLGAHVAERLQAEQTPPPKLAVKRMPDLELPLAVDLNYFNSPTTTNNRYYEQASARSTRFTKAATTQESLTVNTPLVLTEDAARQGAERINYQQWTERTPFQLSLPPKYLYLTPTDPVIAPVAGGTARVRLERVDVGLFGELQCQGVIDSADVLVQTIGGAVLPDAAAPSTEASETTLVAFSINALRDADADAIGFYAAASGPADEDWPGATLYWSRDGGASYQVLASLRDGATLGETSSTLADSGNWQTWDMSSTVDVTITAGDAPATASDAEVLNGANAALVGDEVIQFATVTSLGGDSYRLSRLLRGRRGTEQAMAGHTSSDRVVLLSAGTVVRVPLDDSLVGKELSLKAVTAGGVLADTDAESLTVTGDELRCYAPSQLAIARDGSNNATLSFVRRTRKGGEWRDLVDVDQPEATLSYTVEILNAPGGGVLRTISGLTTESTSYSAADQTTDGLTPGAAFTWRVGQVGKFNTVGYKKEFTG